MDEPNWNPDDFEGFDADERGDFALPRDPTPFAVRFLPWREPELEPLEAPLDWRPERGSELLAGEHSRAILRKLYEGDALAIERLCMHRLQMSALLLDLSELFLESVARVAHDAHEYRADEPLPRWLDERIQHAVRRCMEQDLSEEHEGLPLAEPFPARCQFLSGLLGIEPALARRACVGFNSLDLPVRRTFFALNVERKSIRRHVAEGHGPPDLARARLRLAVDTLLHWGGRPRGGPSGGAR